MSFQEKITAKRKAHLEAVSTENRQYHFVFVNYLSIVGAVYYNAIMLINSELQVQTALFSIVLSIAGIGAIAVFTLALFKNHFIRLLVITVSDAWLCFYWVWEDGNLLGLMPAALLYLARRIIRTQ